MTKVSLVNVVEAQKRLAPILRSPEPLRARWLEERVGGPVYLILENLQRAGSFKIRGAFNRMAQLSDDEKALGVVAASAGNHAQGVALAAQILGIKATVFMPTDASIPKAQATRDYGADVIPAGSTVDEAITNAKEFARGTGAIFIHPFDSADVVAGQGTLGLEIVQSIPDLQSLVVCTGGGGLLAGMALVMHELMPQVRVTGAQAEDAAAYPASLAAGKPTSREFMNTMADGIAVGKPGDVPFAIIHDLGIPIVTVSEHDISRAVLLLLERSKQLVEPAGAAATAAVLASPTSFTPPVAITLSGGNVDPLILMRILRHGLASDGRFLSLTIRAADRPGSLASMLAVIEKQRGNVVDVVHNRLSADLDVDQVEISIEIETRGTTHGEAIVHNLTEAGFIVQSA